jgi:hypothetical protein
MKQISTRGFHIKVLLRLLSQPFILQPTFTWCPEIALLLDAPELSLLHELMPDKFYGASANL